MLHVKINKFFKILIIVFILINITNLFFSKVNAATTIDDVMNSAKNFIKKGESLESKDPIAKSKDIKTNLDFIYNIFLAIGLVILVIWGLILGIKFMVGAAEEKAEIKEMLVPYTVGAVIILGAFGIWKFVIVILNNI